MHLHLNVLTHRISYNFEMSDKIKFTNRIYLFKSPSTDLDSEDAE